MELGNIDRSGNILPSVWSILGKTDAPLMLMHPSPHSTLPTPENQQMSHPMTLSSKFIIWFSYYFFPHSSCSVKRTRSQNLSKFRMSPGHTPHRSTMCLRNYLKKQKNKILYSFFTHIEFYLRKQSTDIFTSVRAESYLISHLIKKLSSRNF